MGAGVDRFTELRAKRFEFLNALYKATGGSRYQFVEMYELGQPLGLGRDETENVADYLQGQGLLMFPVLGGMVAITQAGIVEVETALSAPEQSTEHFPPLNFIYVERMEHSQIQQGTTDSTQTGTFAAADLELVRQFVDDLRARLPDLGLSTVDREEASLQITTAEVQVASRRPNPVILREALNTIRNVLEGGAGSIAATALLQQLPQVIALLPK